MEVLWRRRSTWRSCWKSSSRSCRSASSRHRWGFLPLAEDALKLFENELHDLALKDHVDGHVGRFRLRAQQCGSKHNGHALEGHPVRFLVVNHPIERERVGVSSILHINDCIFKWSTSGSGICENLLADSLSQVSEEQLHGVMVGQRQRLNQVLHVGDLQALVWDLCTDTEQRSL